MPKTGRLQETVFAVFVTFLALLPAPRAHAATYSGGTGTEPDPYLISMPQDLQDLSNPVNSADWDKHFLMTQDIDMTGVTGFTPIGDNTTYFSGNVDGGGFRVQNLVIDLPDHDYVGLIGRADGANVSDLGIDGGSVTGRSNVGGLAGYCGMLTRCYSTAAVSAGYGSAGGLASSGATVTACYATGSVSAGDNGAAGGLVASIAQSRTVIACYSTGNVTSASTLFGGLVGSCEGGQARTSFWDSETSLQSEGPAGKPLTTTQMQTVSIFQNAGWSAHGWAMQAGEYPRLAWEGTGAPPIPVAQPVPLPGSGTEVDPYLVGTTQDFSSLNGRVDFLDAHIRLTANIDCSGEDSCLIGDLGFFSGVLDGDNHVLSNVTLALPATSNLGLFRNLAASGEIRDLSVANIGVTGHKWVGGLLGRNSGGTITNCTVNGTIDGTSYVGGLIGTSSGGSVSGCFTSGTVTSNGRYVGGLCASAYWGAIADSGSSAFVSGPEWRVGGLIGDLGSSLDRCFASGAVSGGDSVGGLIGFMYTGAVTNCYAWGDVTATGSYYGVGGLLGYLESGSLAFCYSRGAVFGAGKQGGLVGGYSSHEEPASFCFWDTESSGEVSSLVGKGATTARMQTISTFANADWHGRGWVMNGGEYPCLAWEGTGAPPIPARTSVALPGSGTELDPYLVATPSEFASLSWHVSLLNAHIELTADIDCAAMDIMPIGDLDTFAGSFNGAGYTVRNVTLEQPVAPFVGLFSYLTSMSKIRNLTIEGVSVTASDQTGALAGYSNGAITDCEVSGLSVSGRNNTGGLVGQNEGTVTASSAYCDVDGNEYVGGLLGLNRGTVTDCHATGAVSGILDHVGGLVGRSFASGTTVTACYSTGDVLASANVGGLVGNNDALIQSCYATGAISGSENIGGLVGYTVSGGTVMTSFATGAVLGGTKLGGLVGFHSGSTIVDSYATGTVAGATNLGGLVGVTSGSVSDSFWDIATGGPDNGIGFGRTTAQMQQRATFEGAGWDFTAGDGDDPDWFIYEGNSYPKLFAMPVPITSIANLQLLNVASGGDFFLTGDIDASVTVGWGSKSTQPGFSPIGSFASPFQGILHGLGHRIYRLHIHRPTMDDVGLFGYIGENGVVDGIGLEQVTITGRDQVGGLAGVNLGTVERCYVRGEVSGVNAVGGLIGDNQGTVSNSYAAAALSGNTVGGLIGTDSSKGGGLE